MSAVQRGTQHATFPAPTSSIWTIEGKSFKFTASSDHETVKDEADADISEVFTNPGHMVSFTGTVKKNQVPAIPGDKITLTYPAGHPKTGAKVYVVLTCPEEGSGVVTKQQVEAKLNDAADYSQT